MTSQFDILFEPIAIGPVTAPNRFYQVPHCNGMGYRMPQSHAAMRGVKAEGGWGVVCTEEVEIHHSSDLMPYIEGRLWDDNDIAPLKLLTDAVHEHNSLAGIELVYNGHHASNLYSRAIPFGVRSLPISGYTPGQSRRMDKEDIRTIRRWHREAAIRAKQAGFDVIYCYAAHNMTLAMHFMLKRYNDRTDEYGGSLENRVRFFREIIEDTKDAVGDSCAIAVRLAVDELLGADGITHEGEGYEIVAMLAELPDLWDVNISGWSNDSATSRFEKEGYQEQYIRFVKTLTSKPVVGVGRYTSPDSMVSAIRRGVMDFIGAARPSIADPFLPEKIREGRFEDIRECIGCNICVSGDMLCAPIRCTQNPTMGEEWRKAWHPEKIAPQKSKKEILVVGGGPSGLECARALGQRGYSVVLVEAQRELGGRVRLEADLPGLSEWRRVAEWRLGQIAKMSNVSLYPENQMTAEDVLETGIDNVVIATGAHWRRDGIGRNHWQAINGSHLPHIFNPDDLMQGRFPTGRVVVYDDDHYYMGGVLAELLANQGCEVTLVTPAPLVSIWTENTLEQGRINQRLLKKNVTIYKQTDLAEIQADKVIVSSVESGQKTELDCDAVVLVTQRIANDALYIALKPALEEKKLSSLHVIGDALAPHIIAQAVYSGHELAREFDEPLIEGTPFRVEYPSLDSL